MKPVMRIPVAIVLALWGCALASATEPVTFAGQKINFLINSGGGSTDIEARLFAKYLARHLPGNPTIIPQNVEGGSGLKLVRYFMELDPKTDPTIAMIASGLPFRARAGIDKDVIDPHALKWLGSYVDSTNACVMNKASGIQSFEDLKGKKIRVGATARNSNAYAMYTMLNQAFDLNFVPVIGYESGGATALAVMRGELDGMCTTRTTATGTFRQSFETGDAKLILYMGPHRRSEIDAPYLFDLDVPANKRDFLKAALASISFGRPLAVHPDTDPDVVAAMQAAFKATIEDPELLKEAAAINIDFRYTSPDELTAAVDALYDQPDALVAEIATLLYAK